MTRSLLQAGKHSRGSLLEVFLSDDEDILATPVVEIDVEAGAHLTYVCAHSWGKAACVVPHIYARVARDATLRILYVGLGGRLTKLFSVTDMIGAGARSEFLSTIFGVARQHFDVDTQQNHRVGNTVSDVLCHVALSDRARSVFAGNILCEPGAQKIDGYQQNRNLLLSDKARADSMPRLEIEANDVRCTHGASFSSYDLAQRFYLQSRGLTRAEAERLLITGFFAAVVERLEHEALEQWTGEQLQRRMHEALGGNA